MKKILYFVLILLVMSFLSGCEEKTTKIGLLLYTDTDISVQEITKQIEKNINPNYELVIYNAEKSQIKQNEQFISLLEEDVDLIVVNLVDRLAAKAYVEKCKKRDIGIIFFNREPLKEDLSTYEKSYYVGSDGEKIGIFQAEIIKNMFRNPDSMRPNYDLNHNNVIELIILKGEQNHQLSETIFEKCIENLTEVRFETDILATEYADWNRETAKEKMAEIYNDPKFKNIDGTSKIELVISNDDQMSLGIIDFIFENNLQLEKNGEYIMPFEIVGANINSESHRRINDNYIYGSITNETSLQAQIILDLIENLLNGSKLIFNYEECAELSLEETLLNNYKYCKKENFIYVSGEIVYAKNA